MLSRYIVQECNSDSPRFAEFWVPAHLSNVQLEHYCATLLSNAMSLCASSIKDPVGVGALRAALTCVRKCCDHPYLVDPAIQSVLTKGIPPAEYLDVGIKASGKLQLLDMMLSEIRNRKERVLILFQSLGGSGKDSIIIGNILDDFLRQRFGPDSYERVDALHSKKQVALDKFNDKNGGRFVFLLENRACAPSIKLSSIDLVIIFGSDWNPNHDLRNLQKITLRSKSENVKVFRLYSSWTLEERILVHAKRNIAIDSIENIPRNTNHKLLMWGAPNLFKMLEEFHGGNNDSNSLSMLPQESHLKNVIDEFCKILTHDDKADSASCSIVSRVRHDGMRYSTDHLLLGELEIEISDEVPHLFWTQLLVGKQPPWKYVSGSSQRNRKRVHLFDDLAEKEDLGSSEAVKKRKKPFKNSHSVKFPQDESNNHDRAREGVSGTSEGGLNELQQRLKVPRTNTFQSNQTSISSFIQCERETKLHDLQRGLHLRLLPEVSKLCKILQLSEDIKDEVERFLEYVMNNHHVPDEPATVLQAFQISLCWTAASWKKHKIDRKESLALATEHLHYACTEEQAERVFSKLRCLKTIFLVHSGLLKVSGASTPMSLDDTVYSIGEASSKLQNLKLDSQQVSQDGSTFVKQDFLLQKPSLVKMVERDISKSLKKIRKKCNKQMSKLDENLEAERKKVLASYEEEKALIENSHRLEASVLRISHENNVTMRTDKINKLDDEYKKKYEDHKRRWESRLKDLDQMQLVVRQREQQKAISMQDELKSWADVELLNKLCSEEPGSSAEAIPDSNQQKVLEGFNNMAHCSDHVSEKTNEVSDSLVLNVPNSEYQLEVPENSGSKNAAENLLTVSLPSPEAHITNVTPDVPHSDLPEQISECITSSNTKVIVRSGDAAENMCTVNLPLPESHYSNDAMSCVPLGDVQEQIPECATSSHVEENARSRDAAENSHTGNLPLPEADMPNDIMTCVPHCDVPEQIPECATSNGIEENFTSNIPDSANQYPQGVISGALPEISSSAAVLVDLVSINQPSSEACFPDKYNVPCTVVSSALAMTLSADANVETTTLVCPTSFVSSNPQDIVSLDPSAREQDPVRITIGVQNVENPKKPGAASSVVENDNTVDDSGRKHPVVTETTDATVVTQKRVDETIISIQDPCLREQSPSLVHQVLGDEQFMPSIIGSITRGDFEASEMRNPPQQTELPGSCSYNAEQCNLSSSGAQLTTAPVAGAGQSLPASVSDDALIPGQASQEALATESNVHSQMEVSAPLPTDAIPSGQSTNYLSAPESLNHLGAGVTEHWPGSNNCGPSQIGQVSLQQHSNIQSHTTNIAMPDASRIPVCSLPDPLHNELERMCKEMEKISKLHEEMMLQLKSDCKKEVEEVIAQIHQKYESKRQAFQAQFLTKTKELEMNQKRVHMNKLLAEAFRSKCMDGRMYSAPRVRQDMNSNIRLPVAVHQSAQQSPQRPCLASNLSSRPLSSQQGSASLCLQQDLTPTSNSMIPPATSLHHSSGPLISNTPRHSQITPVFSPTSLQGSSEPRAPAPHLARFRPSISMTANLSPHTCPIPNQMAHNNLPAVSPLLSQFPSQVLPNQMVHNNPPAASPLLAHIPTQIQMQLQQPAPCNRSPQPETEEQLPSLPAQPLAMDTFSGRNLYHPDIDMGSDFVFRTPTDINTQNSVQVNSTHTTETDVVCLSDDD